MAEGNKWATMGSMRDDFEAYRNLRDAEIERSDLRGMVRRIRQLPISDRIKKRELAFFFQSEEGSRYDTDDRRRAYDEALGRDRNRRQT